VNANYSETVEQQIDVCDVLDARIAHERCQDCGKQAQTHRNGTRNFYCYDCEDAATRTARIEFSPFPRDIANVLWQNGLRTLEEVRELAREGLQYTYMRNVGQTRKGKIIKVLEEINATPHCTSCQCWKA
jgi:ribosomal protein L37AE/L43A